MINGYPIFTDFAHTIDENRLMIKVVLPSGLVVYLPANKEIQRALFTYYGIDEAIEQSKVKYDDNWRDHLFEFTTSEKLEEATKQSIFMMEQAVGLVGNMILGRNVFEAKPIAEWLDLFLPFASHEQYLTTGV